MAATRAEIQESVEEILSPVTSRQSTARIVWRLWLLGMALALLAYLGRGFLAHGLGMDLPEVLRLARTWTLGWPLGLVLVGACHLRAKAAAADAARAFRAAFAPDSEARRWAFRQLLRRWHEQPAARTLALAAGTAPGRSTRSPAGVPWEENVFATVAPLARVHALRRRLGVAYGLLCGAAILYPLALHGLPVAGALGCGLAAAFLGALVLVAPAKQAWGHRLDGVRARWNTRFAGTDGPTAETEAVLARVALALPAAAELLRDPAANPESGSAPPSGDPTASLSLSRRLGSLRARIPLRLPRPAPTAERSPRRNARLPEAPNASEYENQRDVEALVASLRRVQRTHVVILWIWWLFPPVVWVLAALAQQEMSFWRAVLVWLLMGFVLGFPSMAHRQQILGWTQRAFLRLFPPGSRGREDALEQLEEVQGATLIAQLVVRLRPPSPAAGASSGQPVEQAIREAVANLGGNPRGIPLPSDPAPTPVPPASRPSRPPAARSARALPLSLPGNAPDDRRKQ